MTDSLSSRLHKLMSEARLTVNEFGRRINMPAVTIKKLKNGENTNPTIGTLKPIAGYFGLTVSQLIGESSLPNTTGVGEHLNKIPVLTWKQAGLWPHSLTISQLNYTLIDHEVSQQTFALLIETDSYKEFRDGVMIIVDPEAVIQHDMHILVAKIGQVVPSLKKVIIEDGVQYITSALKNLDLTLELTDDYKVLGGIIGVQQFFDR